MADNEGRALAAHEQALDVEACPERDTHGTNARSKRKRNRRHSQTIGSTSHENTGRSRKYTRPLGVLVMALSFLLFSAFRSMKGQMLSIKATLSNEDVQSRRRAQAEARVKAHKQRVRMQAEDGESETAMDPSLPNQTQGTLSTDGSEIADSEGEATTRPYVYKGVSMQGDDTSNPVEHEIDLDVVGSVARGGIGGNTLPKDSTINESTFAKEDFVPGGTSGELDVAYDLGRLQAIDATSDVGLERLLKHEDSYGPSVPSIFQGDMNVAVRELDEGDSTLVQASSAKVHSTPNDKGIVLLIPEVNGLRTVGQSTSLEHPGSDVEFTEASSTITLDHEGTAMLTALDTSLRVQTEDTATGLSDALKWGIDWEVEDGDSIGSLAGIRDGAIGGGSMLEEATSGEDPVRVSSGYSGKVEYTSETRASDWGPARLDGMSLEEQEAFLWQAMKENMIAHTVVPGRMTCLVYRLLP
mmetsp:Transcript_2635/g.9547  ORF Transcript_2635/g.9547 Transcript_2635/m.9547 type:complete len:470 (+) Transcript_2635:83-1492(+)